MDYDVYMNGKYNGKCINVMKHIHGKGKIQGEKNEH